MVQLQPDPPDQRTEDRGRRTEFGGSHSDSSSVLCPLSSVLCLLIRGCSSAGRAPALQAGGHRFDPVHLHHFRGLRTEDRRQRIKSVLKSAVLCLQDRRAVRSLTNRKKYNHTILQFWNGVAGFRLYVSPVSMEEFDGGGSNTSAEVKTCGFGLWG